MITTTSLLLVSLLACGGEAAEPSPEEAAIPKGPNLKTPSPVSNEPYEIVLLQKVLFSGDGSLAHYHLLHQNRKQGGKEGFTRIGYLVDVATGKTLGSYQVDQNGFMCPSLKPAWDKAKPRAWGEAILAKGAFVEGKQQVRHPDAKAGIAVQLVGTKTLVGWIVNWPYLNKYLAWSWRAFKRPVPEDTKFEAKLELQIKRKGEDWKTLHAHQPYLDYHYALMSRYLYTRALEREAGELRYPDGPPVEPRWCTGENKEDAACTKAKNQVGLMSKNEYAFSGEVTLIYSPAADAVLAFWDDRQVRAIDTPGYHVVFRSYVTVHALAARQPSTLVPPDEPPRPTLRTEAMEARAGETGMDAMAGTGAKPGRAAPKEQAPAAKKGCGCATTAPESAAGLILVLAVILGLRARRHARGRRA